MGQINNHKSNFNFLILGCKSFAVNYSLKSGDQLDISVRWVSSLVMLCQASTATVFSSCLFLGHFPFSFFFSKWNACSIGFRSGDWLGHCITFHFFPLKSSCSFHFKSIVVAYRAKKIRIVSMSQYLWTWLYIYIHGGAVVIMILDILLLKIFCTALQTFSGIWSSQRLHFSIKNKVKSHIVKYYYSLKMKIKCIKKCLTFLRKPRYFFSGFFNVSFKEKAALIWNIIV